MNAELIRGSAAAADLGVGRLAVWAGTRRRFIWHAALRCCLQHSPQVVRCGLAIAGQAFHGLGARGLKLVVCFDKGTI